MKKEIKYLLTGSVILVNNLFPSISQEQPNILFLAVDDLKPILNAYGQSQVKTPNIDRIANQGVTFLNTYCQKAVCGPSRASLLTGLRPDNTGILDLKTLIRDVHPEILTLPQHFKNNGYQTAAVGKVFDPRSVDDDHDAISWTEPYTKSSKLPLAVGYEDLIYGSYQSDMVRDSMDYYCTQAELMGLSGTEADDYVKLKVKPSVESANVPDNAYRDGAHTIEALGLIEKFYNSDQPFFLALGYKKPHLPFVAPEKYWKMYNREEIDIATFQEMALNSPEEAYNGSSEMSGYTDIPFLSDFSDYSSNVLDSAKQKELIHGYYACISYIDAQIGIILDKLTERNLIQNTIIVFWGDHGFHLGDHAMWGKHTVFEQATRSPLIVSAPGYSISQKTDAITEFVDIFPSLCDLAGLEVPVGLDGRSFIDCLANPQAEIKDFAVSQYSRKGLRAYSLRNDRYRYTEWFPNQYDSGKPYDTLNIRAVELYDYLYDSLETINLAGSEEYAKLQLDLHLELKSFLETGEIPLYSKGVKTELNNDLKIYPNPANETLIISYGKIKEEFVLKIYNTNGTLIWEQASHSNQEINLRGLSKGIYILDVNGYTQKLLIN